MTPFILNCTTTARKQTDLPRSFIKEYLDLRRKQLLTRAWRFANLRISVLTMRKKVQAYTLSDLLGKPCYFSFINENTINTWANKTAASADNQVVAIQLTDEESIPWCLKYLSFTLTLCIFIHNIHLRVYKLLACLDCYGSHFWD